MSALAGFARRLKERLSPWRQHLGLTQQRTYAYLGGNRALTQLSTGSPFFVNTDDRAISPWIILGGRWETFVDNVLMRLTKPGMSFLDIGANMGYYSVKAGVAVGAQGKLYSFEPNPELYSFLVDNVDVNGLRRRTTTWQTALGDEPGRADLHFDHKNMGAGTLGKKGALTRSVSVAVDTLDRLLPAGTRIDLIKIDAEGYEPKIIAGGQRLLAENPHAAVILEVSVKRWRRIGSPEHVFQTVVGPDKEVFQIRPDGLLIPFSSPEVFLKTLETNFLAYCLIVPKASTARQDLADLIGSHAI